MKISLASPVYNESGKIQEFIHRASQTLLSISDDIEIVLVNDCSPDNTLEKIREILPLHPYLKLINLNRNSGQLIATTIALKHTTGEIIFLMDSDLQVNPEYMLNFYKCAELNKNWDVISAQRITRSKKIMRQFGSKLISLLLQKINKSKLNDIGSSFKLMNRKVLDRLISQDILIQNYPILMLNLKLKIIEYPIEYNKIQERRSNYKFSDLIYTIMLALLNFSTGASTLVILVGLGILLLFGGITSLVGIIIWGVFYKSILPTNLLIFSLVLTIIGVQFILLSMVVFKLERINKNLDFRKFINQRIEYEN